MATMATKTTAGVTGAQATILMVRPARWDGDYVLEAVNAEAAEVYYEMGWNYPA
jgi:hypothetical protein